MILGGMSVCGVADSSLDLGSDQNRIFELQLLCEMVTSRTCRVLKVNDVE